jgi:hypothetical protein
MVLLLGYLGRGACAAAAIGAAKLMSAADDGFEAEIDLTYMVGIEPGKRNPTEAPPQRHR